MQTSTARTSPPRRTSRSDESELVAKPFLKWAGGKRQSLPLLLSHIPKDFNRYFEPMVGAGALFFALSTRYPELDATLSDVNRELINCYDVVRGKLPRLITLLERYAIDHSRRHFYQVREVDRDSAYWTWSDVERAARFIYLNKTCFNGLYRVNSRGEFNVPFGEYKNPAILDRETLTTCSRQLQDVELLVSPYQSIVEGAQAGDLVYFDPPYMPVSPTASFTSYAKEGFGEAEQEELATVFQTLTNRGVYVMLSNSSVPKIRALFKDFNIIDVEVPRAINSRADRRGRVGEVLVKNF